MRKKKDRPKRLTRKEFLSGCEYALNPWASGNEAQDKLGPIEDIEDEINGLSLNDMSDIMGELLKEKDD